MDIADRIPWGGEPPARFAAEERCAQRVRDEEQKLRIHIGNLSFDTTEENLETAFSAHGSVRSVSIIRDRQTWRFRGFGFVETDDDEEASAALTALNGTELDARTFTVHAARPRAGKSGGDWGRGESQGRKPRW